MCQSRLLYSAHMVAFPPACLQVCGYYTGANLEVHNTLDMCYAGYHYDLNFLTIHGKSRFPGLFVWLRNGKRVAVRIPAGCLFIQAGKQLEWLTGGYVKAGMHEVSCNIYQYCYTAMLPTLVILYICAVLCCVALHCSFLCHVMSGRGVWCGLVLVRLQ